MSHHHPHETNMKPKLKGNLACETMQLNSLLLLMVLERLSQTGQFLEIEKWQVTMANSIDCEKEPSGSAEMLLRSGKLQNLKPDSTPWREKKQMLSEDLSKPKCAQNTRLLRLLRLFWNSSSNSIRLSSYWTSKSRRSVSRGI